jgi:hypothetical protein
VPLELIVAIVVLVAIVVAVAWWSSQRRRTDRLRERFGPEYERTVESADSRRRAEAELEARQERIEALDIRTLSGPDRARFGERWRVVQALFVDDPPTAVEQADTLIGEVMRARGYPVGDFEQRAADISVDHPQVVDHYRTAHQIAERRVTGDVDTEHLRQAFVHYRALFAELLESGGDGPAEGPAVRITGDAADDPMSAGTETVEPPPDRAPHEAARPATQPAVDEPAEPARRP